MSPSGSDSRSTIFQGLKFGAGNAIGHRIADALMGRRVTYIYHVTPEGSYSDSCGVRFMALRDCLDRNATDISKCQQYMEMLSKCRKGSASSSSA